MLLQNPTAEFRTADRCALSSGHLMAASYKMATGDKCKPTASDVAEELKRQTDQCRSIDEMVRLPHEIIEKKHGVSPRTRL